MNTEPFTNLILFSIKSQGAWLFTVCWADFKQNCKNFWWDLRRVKEHASEIQNIFFLKSCNEGHGIHQLGSTADSARFRPNRLCCLAGGFQALIARISKNIYSESPNNARSPYEGPVHVFYNFIRFLLSVLCGRVDHLHANSLNFRVFFDKPVKWKHP